METVFGDTAEKSHVVQPEHTLLSRWGRLCKSLLLKKLRVIVPLRFYWQNQKHV